MITFSRVAARRYWAVLRPLLAGVPRRSWPSIHLSAAHDGVVFSVQHDQTGLEYLVPGGQAPCRLTVPWELLPTVFDSRADSITLSAAAAGGVLTEHAKALGQDGVASLDGRLQMLDAWAEQRDSSALFEALRDGQLSERRLAQATGHWNVVP